MKHMGLCVITALITGCTWAGMQDTVLPPPSPEAVRINFGTLGEPDAFDRSDWSLFRDSLTQTGIIRPEYTFETTLADADWHLFLWMETGYEDSVTTRFYINEEEIFPDFMPFNPPAEPPATPQRLMRLVQHPAPLRNNTFTLHIEGVQDSVRLLALMLVPDGKQATTPAQRAFLNELSDLGRFQQTASVEPLLHTIRSMQHAPANRNFSLYWSTQLDWFATGERYYLYRGWERLRPLTGMALFEHMHQSVMYLDGILNTPDAAENPLFERALWLRGRILWWLDLERGGLYEEVYAMKDLRRMRALQPTDSLVRMYNGEKLRSPSRADAFRRPPNAPDWSWKQFEILNRLGEIADYWVSIQDTLGEMGGKLGDDVEILRWWPIVIASGHDTAMRGWKNLADGVWNSRHIRHGYARAVSDVEHASEFISDTAPNMVIFSDDPEYVHRLSYSAAHFDTLWTGINPQGRRFFRSAWFSSTQLDTSEPKNRDVALNARATKAVRYYAWKTGDERAIQTLTEWSKAWVHAATRTDKGKPKGVIPASVRYPDEAFNGDEPTWYKANMFWSYFDWSGGVAILDQQVFMWSLTGNDSLLIPLRLNLDLVRNYHGQNSPDRNTAGSEAWAAFRLMNNANFWSTAGEWRLRSGDTSYDDIMMIYGTPYTRFRISGDISHMNESFELILSTIRYNIPLLTTDAIHTDRIYVSPHRSGADDQIKALITGDQSAENASPYTAVTWANTNSLVTMLVIDHGNNRLRADVYSYDPNQRTIIMKPWQLEPGTYRIRVNNASELIEIRKRGQEIPISIASNERVQIEIST